MCQEIYTRRSNRGKLYGAGLRGSLSCIRISLPGFLLAFAGAVGITGLQMDWLQICVSTHPDAEEIVSEALLQAGAAGVQTEGFVPEKADISPLDYTGEQVEQQDSFSVCAYFACDGTEQRTLENIRERLRAIREMELGIPLGELGLSTAMMQEKDWENSWKEYYKPVRISDYIIVSPTWEEYGPKEGEIVLWIDPGMAFGTGTHESTRLCVRLLEEFLEEGMTVLDVGCGSGILSLAACKLGAKKVLAMDVDSVALRVTGENAARNGCAETIEIIWSDLMSAVPEETKADIIVANIIADAIIALCPDARARLKRNGMLLCSGIIDNREADVRAALEANGYRIISIREEGEWRAIAAEYKG